MKPDCFGGAPSIAPPILGLMACDLGSAVDGLLIGRGIGRSYLWGMPGIPFNLWGASPLYENETL